MSYPLPAKALAQHIAFLGKTGSGKTTSAKGAVEHILRSDPAARVCVLDPIKSDWWGMTSSDDGRRPGFPFVILGGPRGHVALHESAGAAIGELVGSGALPLSIIDMADFGPGGLQRFFNDFAPTLMSKIRGVVHLVLEEAHEFAPKERAGLGNENLAIHYAKKLATAGRSKGIRLMVLTQSVQQLHNRVLGSCETIAAHRLTAPADQEPVKKWLKTHLDKAKYDEVSGGLSRLKTGTAWVCSGEAQVALELKFPPLTTFDNSATPDGSAQLDVKTATVDQDRLRAIIGDAVKQAEANDPAELRKRIRELEAEVAKPRELAVDVDALRKEYQRGYSEGREEGAREKSKQWQERVDRFRGAQVAAMSDLVAPMPLLPPLEAPPAPSTPFPASTAAAAKGPGAPPPDATAGRASTLGGGSGAAAEGLGKGDRLVLTVLAEYHPKRVSASKAAAISGYSIRSSTWRNILSRLRQAGHIEQGQEPYAITPAGLAALGSFEPLPTGPALLKHWMQRVGKGDSETLRILATLRGECPSSDLAHRAGYSPSSSTWRNILSRLRVLGLIEGSRNIKLHEDLR